MNNAQSSQAQATVFRTTAQDCVTNFSGQRTYAKKTTEQKFEAKKG